jgi:hypothetical protein
VITRVCGSQIAVRSLVRHFIVLIVGLAALGACRGSSQVYTSLGTHAAPLRAQFNQDAGRTRIVILPAPN